MVLTASGAGQRPARASWPGWLKRTEKMVGRSPSAKSVVGRCDSTIPAATILVATVATVAGDGGAA